MKINIDMLCTLSCIMDKLNIDTNTINKYFKMGEAGKGKSKSEIENLQKKIGMEIMIDLGKKIHLVKDELIELISMYKEITTEEAKKVNIIDFFKEIAKDEDIKNFLKKKATSDLKKN